MENKKLEVLIVEDREENRAAAEKALAKDVNLDFAANYNEGIQKIQQGSYDLGIFDLELPKTESAMPEKLGFELAEEAEKHLVPWVVITSGIDHHRCKAAFVSYFWKNKTLSEITEIPKTNPEAWKRVYETLTKPPLDKPTYLALKRINPDNPAKVLLMPLGRLARQYLEREK